MVVRTQVRVFAIAIGVIAAIFFIKSIIFLSHEDLAKSAQLGGYDLAYAETLCRHHSDVKAGFILVLFSFLLQSVDFIWPLKWESIVASWRGMLIILMLIILTFISFNCWSEYDSKETYKKVEKILLKK